MGFQMVQPKVEEVRRRFIGAKLIQIDGLGAQVPLYTTICAQDHSDMVWQCCQERCAMLCNVSNGILIVDRICFYTDRIKTTPGPRFPSNSELSGIL